MRTLPRLGRGTRTRLPCHRTRPRSTSGTCCPAAGYCGGSPTSGLPAVHRGRDDHRLRPGAADPGVIGVHIGPMALRSSETFQQSSPEDPHQERHRRHADRTRNARWHDCRLRHPRGRRCRNRGSDCGHRRGRQSTADHPNRGRLRSTKAGTGETHHRQGTGRSPADRHRTHRHHAALADYQVTGRGEDASKNTAWRKANADAAGKCGADAGRTNSFRRRR